MNKLTTWALLLLLAQCTEKASQTTSIALVGATVLDGTNNPPIENAVMIIADGKIIQLGSSDEISIPDNAERISVKGKTIMPGIINAHGHIGGTIGLTVSYSADNVLRDLRTSAYYGVTTVYSLGGDEAPSVAIRNQQDSVLINESRLFIAGEVITGKTPEEARAAVDRNAAMGVDVIKLRVDDNLGTTEKMPPEIYTAVIDQANLYKLPVAAHIFYLEDAKALLRLGVRIIAHSVRDQPADDEFIKLMIEKEAFYIPTLMREVSTFVYEDTPSFFNDPFFLAQADTSILQQLRDPARQQKIKQSESAKAYKQALEIANVNLIKLADAGVQIAFGTDTGPPARFQGYFEHLELERMVDAGLTPTQVLRSATYTSALCLNKLDIGTLEQGHYADFIVLQENPLIDIKNSRTIEDVWINGTKVKRVKMN